MVEFENTPLQEAVNSMKRKAHDCFFKEGEKKKWLAGSISLEQKVLSSWDV